MENKEMHIAHCKKCNQMTNHNKEGECLKCLGITMGWEYLFWNESVFAGDCVWNEKVADFGLINKIVKEAQEGENKIYKFKIMKGNKTEREVIKLIILERKKTHKTIDAIYVISRLREIADNVGEIMDNLGEVEEK